MLLFVVDNLTTPPKSPDVYFQDGYRSMVYKNAQSKLISYMNIVKYKISLAFTKIPVSEIRRML